MNGVFGLINSKTLSISGNSILPEIARTLCYLPWFQSNHFVDEASGSGLGSVHIGIFNPEIQPCHVDEQVFCVFAGELYKTQKIRQSLETQGVVLRNQSNAELALHLYLEKGIDFVKHIEGIFCIAIWDRRHNLLHIINDRFGMRPLYYAHNEKRFIFAPEIKGILADPDFSKVLDLTALSEYIRFQQLIGDKTFFEGISLLPPASQLTLNIGTNSLRIHTYWDWRSIEPQTGFSSQEISEEAERLFTQAVNQRMEGDWRYGIYLSGGLDSRLVLASLNPAYLPIQSITYGHQNCRDVAIAQRIAHAVGTNHHFFELENGNWVKEVSDLHLELTEAAHPWNHAHGLSILPEVRQLIDINLSGYGGGTVMGGAFDNPAITHAPDEYAFLIGMFNLYTQKHTWPGLTDAETQLLYTSDYSKKLLGVAFESLRSEVTKYDHPDNSLRSLFFNLHNHDRRMNFNLIVFHSAYFENRLPYYDYSLVEFMASLSSESRRKKQIHCDILDRMYPRLALIPRDSDNRLPTQRKFIYNSHRIWTRANELVRQWLLPQSADGYAETLYADYENYLRHELRPWAESLLFDERTDARGIFRPEMIQSLTARHMSGNEEWTIGKIAPIMSFEMMLRRYFD